MAHIEKTGYAQLELNNAAFRRSGRIEAQCKIAEGIEYLENGMLLAVDNAKREVKFVNEDTKHLPVALNYTSEHMYDNRADALKNFKLEPGSFLPRLGYLGAGDKYTTNCVDYNGNLWEEISKGTVLYAHAGADGYHLVNTTATDAIAIVIEATTMPDGQKAVKFQAL